MHVVAAARHSSVSGDGCQPGFVARRACRAQLPCEVFTQRRDELVLLLLGVAEAVPRLFRVDQLAVDRDLEVARFARIVVQPHVFRINLPAEGVQNEALRSDRLLFISSASTVLNGHNMVRDGQERLLAGFGRATTTLCTSKKGKSGW